MPAHSSRKDTFEEYLSKEKQEGLQSTERNRAETSTRRVDKHASGKPELEQSVLPCSRNGLRPVLCPKLREDVGNMFLCGRKRDDELVGDGLVRCTLS